MKSDVLKSYVPEFLIQSQIFNTIYDIQGSEFDTLDAAIEDIKAQCFIDSATWGLKYWEELLGIPVDEMKPIGFRRTVVKSKVRGTGTITVGLIQSVAQSYDNGEVDVIENNSNYSFEVKFTGTKGIPPNINDLKAAIEVIKPAHLAVTYTFTYKTYSEVAAYTHNQLTAYTHDQIRVL